MNAGQDKTMIEIHERALNRIGDVLIELQDETIKRMSDALEASEDRSAAAEDAIWDQVINHVKRMNGGHCDYNESPLELITNLADERDALTAQLEAMTKERDALKKQADGQNKERWYHPALDEGDGVYRP